MFFIVKKFKKAFFIGNFFLVLLAFQVLFSPNGFVTKVFAAAMSLLSDTQSSLKVSTLSDHTIQFVTPTGLIAGQTITVTFPGGYATGTFAIANFDLATSTSATCSGFVDSTIQAGAASGATWGVAVASTTLTFTSGTATIPANRCVQIEIGGNATFGAAGTTTMTNPSSPGSYVITLGGTLGDTGSITQNIITDDTVSVSATVQQSLTFTISTTTIYFGNLGSGSVKFASSTNTAGDAIETIAHTLAVSTNAPSGYNLSLRGQTLTSQQNATNTISAIGSTASSSNPGFEQFGLRATVAGGSGSTIDLKFSSSTAYGYDSTATTSSLLATGSGATNVSMYSLRYMANIAALTEAGTYVANMVYVATANY